MYGFGLEIVMASLLSFYFVSPSLRKSVANFATHPTVVKGFLGYAGLLGIMFLASVMRIIFGFRHLDNIAAQVNQLVYQKNALLYGTSIIFLVLIYNLAKLTQDSTRFTNVDREEKEASRLRIE